MNAKPMPIPYALRKPSQPSESQSPDASEGTPTSAPLPGVIDSSPLNGATSGLPPSPHGNEGPGETETLITKVGSASSIIKTNTNVMPIHYALHKPS